MDQEAANLWFFNGIDGATGEYALRPMSPGEVFALALGQSINETERADLESRRDELQRPHAGVEADARNLNETGWGVIFAYEDQEAQAIREALGVLLKRRKEQAEDKYREYVGQEGYLPGESKLDWLDRHGMGPGPVDPERVPYYLLIVGAPDRIPYSFQYQLDVQYAVGRVYFDRLEEYAAYAQSVVDAETRLTLRPKATFFGVANPGDRATNLSVEQLIQPLAQKIAEKQPKWAELAQKARTAAGLPGLVPKWEIESILKDDATKARLAEMLHGGEAPALLFTASHGMAFPRDHERQLSHQGALLCQDWPGPEYWQGPIPEDHYFSADDLSSDSNLLGTLAFFFACYGAGTPQEDEFATQIWGDKRPERKVIAPYPFLARLPMRMLGLPKGGALAVVGHVERAWGCSFMWGSSGPQLQVFEDCLARLLKDYPIGYALEVFNNRYAELSTELIPALEKYKDFGKKVDQQEVAGLWTSNNDARNYVILGDPAARLFVGNGDKAQAARPVIEITRPSVAAAVGKAAPAQAKAAAAPKASPAAEAAAVDYGLLDSFKQAQANMGATLQQFTEKLSAFMSMAIEEATTLEVATYVSEDLGQVEFKEGKFVGARLRALTRVEIDGDTLMCVPERDGEVDTALWAIHTETVKQAQQSRAELLKTLVSAATNMLAVWKP